MGTDKPLISVVVPIYKAESYLRQCVDSLLTQSYEKLEIVLVNDGSPDGSGAICDAYAAADERVKVLHQSNKGVSAARNVGMAMATGAYIAFVDADDWVGRDYLEYLLGLICFFDAQIAVCGCSSLSRESRRCTREEALKLLLYQKGFDVSPCWKLFRTDLAKRVKFPEGMFFEDLAVACRMFAQADTVACGRQGGYFYRATPNGTMHGGDVRRLLWEIQAADMMAEYILEYFPSLAAAAESRRFSAYCQVLMKLPGTGYDEERKKLWRYIKKIRLSVLTDFNVRFKNRVAVLASFLGESVMRWLWKAGK